MFSSMSIFLNECKKNANIHSDLQLAKQAKIDRSSISYYRNKDVLPTDEVALRLGRLGGFNDEKILIMMGTFRSSGEAKNVYRGMQAINPDMARNVNDDLSDIYPTLTSLIEGLEMSAYISTVHDLVSATNINEKRAELILYNKGMPTENEIIEICKLLQIDTIEALTMLNIWQSKGTKKTYYTEVLKKLTACAAIGLTLGFAGMGADANALVLHDIHANIQQPATASNINYAIFIL